MVWSISDSSVQLRESSEIVEVYVESHAADSMTLMLDVGGAGVPRRYHALISVEHYANHMFS